MCGRVLVEEGGRAGPAAIQPPLDLGPAERRVESTRRLEPSICALRHDRCMPLAPPFPQFGQQGPGDEGHVPRDDQDRAVAVRQRGVNAAEGTQSGPDVRDAANSRQPRVGGRVVRDEQQIVGRFAERRRYPIDQTPASYGRKPLGCAEPRAGSTGEDYAGAARVSRARRRSPAAIRLPRPSLPSLSPRRPARAARARR
jgi:hypothetical protein